VLHHLFTFLTLKDFCLAARTHQRWRSAAISMKPRGDFVSIREASQFDAVLDSPLRRHVTNLEVFTERRQSVDELHQLGDSMHPHLTWLNFTLQVDHGLTGWRWPVSLTELQVTFVHKQDVSAEIDSVLGESIAGLLHLRSLTIARNPASTAISSHMLEPLLTLPSLTALDFLKRVDTDLMAVIRRFPHLKQFSPINFFRADPQRLLEGNAPIPPLQHHPSWIGFVIDETTAPLLLKLAPTLTELEGACLLPDIERFLAQMPKVLKLTVNVHHDEEEEDDAAGVFMQRDSFIAGVRVMPQLTHLRLGHLALTNEHLCTILQQLRVLQRLQLWCTPALESLAFLAHAPSTLVELKLTGAGCLPHAEDRHLGQLPQLERLHLGNIFQRRSPRMLDWVDPKSPAFDRAKWPSLVEFVCNPC
jgi:hypothetical protein